MTKKDSDDTELWAYNRQASIDHRSDKPLGDVRYCSTAVHAVTRTCNHGDAVDARRDALPTAARRRHVDHWLQRLRRQPRALPTRRQILLRKKTIESAVAGSRDARIVVAVIFSDLQCRKSAYTRKRHYDRETACTHLPQPELACRKDSVQDKDLPDLTEHRVRNY